MYIIQFISMFLPGKYKPILEMKCERRSCAGARGSRRLLTESLTAPTSNGRLVRWRYNY